jgi:hypothetical protein
MAIITITGDNNANVLTGTSATDQYNINGLGGNDNMNGGPGAVAAHRGESGFLQRTAQESKIAKLTKPERQNADGYGLTKAQMAWFIAQYVRGESVCAKGHAKTWVWNPPQWECRAG